MPSTSKLDVIQEMSRRGSSYSKPNVMPSANLQPKISQSQASKKQAHSPAPSLNDSPPPSSPSPSVGTAVTSVATSSRPGSVRSHQQHVAKKKKIPAAKEAMTAGMYHCKFKALFIDFIQFSATVPTFGQLEQRVSMSEHLTIPPIPQSPVMHPPENSALADTMQQLLNRVDLLESEL
jgi:hypothetical protein